MIEILFLIFLYSVTTEVLNTEVRPESIVKSSMEFYRSRSVVLVFDENLQNSDFGLLGIQKRLSFESFYFSSLTTQSGFVKSLRNIRPGTTETVVVFNISKSFIRILEKIFGETDAMPHKWLLTGGALAFQDFENLTIPLHTEFLLAGRNRLSGGYDLTEIYDVQPKRRKTRALGLWVEGEEFKVEPDVFKRRGDLGGVAIRVVSPELDPCRSLSFMVGVATIASCIHQRVWEVLSEMLNATTEIQVIPDLTPSTIETTDAELTFRSAPLNVWDLNTRTYLWPVFRVKVFLVTRLVEQEVQWETYILPFSQQMWMVIFLWMLLCDFILAVAEFVARKKKTRNSFTDCCTDVSFSTAFTYCSQGVLGPSTSSSTRIVFLMMLIVPGILLPGYSAVVTSFLTVQVYKKPFQSLEELSRTDEYKIGWHNTYAMENMFNLKDMEPLNQALLQNNVLSQDELPATDAEGLQRMCDNKFSYLTIKETIMAVKPKCSFYTLQQHFKIVFTSMEMKKGSWYKHLLDRCQRVVDFSGVLHRIVINIVMRFFQYKMFNLRVNEVQAIKVENIILPFAILLMGVATSAILLIVEIVWFKLKSTQRSVLV